MKTILGLAFFISTNLAFAQQALEFTLPSNPSIKVEYEGEVKNGKANGYGEGRAFSKDDYIGIYKGSWKDNAYHGKGKFGWRNGDIYEGDWKDGNRNGQGTFTWGADSQWEGDIYTGDFANNQRHGRGTLIWANGNKYEGDWKDDRRNGKGTLIWANGDKYEGDWKDDRRNGRGTFVWGPNSQWKGDTYTGDFANNQLHGHGRYTHADGTIKEGNWKNDYFKGGSDAKKYGESGEKKSKAASADNIDTALNT